MVVYAPAAMPLAQAAISRVVVTASSATVQAPVACARAGQKIPEGYYNLELMLGKVLRRGEVALCGTCMDARGMTETDMIEGARRSTLAELADWTAVADKVLVF